MLVFVGLKYIQGKLRKQIAFHYIKCCTLGAIQKVGHTAQKMRLSIKDLFSKCDQICWKLRIWSHLLKKSLMENFIFCAVSNGKGGGDQ